jgi:hypothetical protein
MHVLDHVPRTPAESHRIQFSAATHRSPAGLITVAPTASLLSAKLAAAAITLGSAAAAAAYAGNCRHWCRNSRTTPSAHPRPRARSQYPQRPPADGTARALCLRPVHRLRSPEAPRQRRAQGHSVPPAGRRRRWRRPREHLLRPSGPLRKPVPWDAARPPGEALHAALASPANPSRGQAHHAALTRAGHPAGKPTSTPDQPGHPGARQPGPACSGLPHPAAGQMPPRHRR